LVNEPTTSTTKLSLRQGELISNVKKLKKDAGSSFEIKTPVGAAGIRGTSFGLQFKPVGRKASFALRMAEGLIELSFGTRARSVEVATRKQVVLTGLDYDPATNAVESIPTVTVSDLPPSDLATLTEGLQQILAAAGDVSFTPNAAANPAVGTGSSGNGEAVATPSPTTASAPVSALASPPAVPPAPNPTPPAGRP
jgi:hypothetical protein